MLDQVQGYTTQDMEYLRFGDRGIGLRLFTPEGKGPFPLVVDIHGGAWNLSDFSSCQDRDEVLAGAGLAVAAIDFRHGPDKYPSSLADINYAIRWLKSKAEAFHIDAGRVGICGQSSGGHLAMLAAMRPADPRYTELPVEGAGPEIDAAVRCAGVSWPVINPLSRYRHAVRTRESGENADWVGELPEFHHIYWETEEVMEEGNPMLALERGEDVETPPALWVQGQPDIVHDYRDLSSGATMNEPERFAANYRAARGEIEVVYVEQARRGTEVSWNPLAAFFLKHLG